jgi:hypothetical protein
MELGACCNNWQSGNTKLVIHEGDWGLGSDLRKRMGRRHAILSPVVDVVVVVKFLNLKNKFKK